MKPLFRSPKDQQTHSRSGIAFIVEMLILLVLVAGCLSVLVQAFAFAHQQGEENSVTVKAVHLASNTSLSIPRCRASKKLLEPCIPQRSRCIVQAIKMLALALSPIMVWRPRGM